MPDCLQLRPAATSKSGLARRIAPFHTGADARQRLIARATFDGPVEAGRRYVIVDDVTVLGGTIAELATHVQAWGGEVVGTALLVNASRSGVLAPDPRVIAEVERRLGDAIGSELEIEPRALTGPEAGYLIGFRDAESLRATIAKARRERRRRLAARGLAPESDPDLGGPGAAEPPAEAYDAGDGQVIEAEADQTPALLRRDQRAVSVGRQPRVVALGIAEDFRREGVAALVGRTVTSPDELAEIAQIYRDPGSRRSRSSSPRATQSSTPAASAPARFPTRRSCPRKWTTAAGRWNKLPTGCGRRWRHPAPTATTCSTTTPPATRRRAGPISRSRASSPGRCRASAVMSFLG